MFSVGKFNSFSVYTLFFFFFNISGAERDFALTSVGLGFAPNFLLDFDLDTRFVEDFPAEVDFDFEDLLFDPFDGPAGFVGAIIIVCVMASLCPDRECACSPDLISVKKKKKKKIRYSVRIYRRIHN